VVVLFTTQQMAWVQLLAAYANYLLVSG